MLVARFVPDLAWVSWEIDAVGVDLDQEHNAELEGLRVVVHPVFVEAPGAAEVLHVVGNVVVVLGTKGWVEFPSVVQK